MDSSISYYRPVILLLLLLLLLLLHRLRAPLLVKGVELMYRLIYFWVFV